MSLRVKCAILKRIVILLSAYEMVALALGSYSVGAKEFPNSVIYFASTIVSFVISYEISYIVSAMIVRIELERHQPH